MRTARRRDDRPLALLAHVAGRTGLAALFAFMGIISALTIGVGSTGVAVLQPHSAVAQEVCYDDGHGGQVCVPGGADAFATSVVSFTPGIYPPAPNFPVCPPNNQGGSASSVLGVSDDQTAGQVGASTLSTSLGFTTGAVVLSIATPLTGGGDGSPDIWVWEVGLVAEPYSVEVSADGVNWTLVGIADAATFGSQGFDIDDDGFDQTARLFYVRITDGWGTDNPGGTCSLEGVNISGADIDAVAVLAAPVPAIDLEKTAEPSTDLEPGDVFTYSFLVRNAGLETLNNITVDDPLEGFSAVDCPTDTLAAGQTTTCTASYTVTADDVQAGVIENTATVTGDPPETCEGCDPPTAEDTEIVLPEQNPNYEITKEADTEGPVGVGETITYTFTVENTGNVPLYNFTIIDQLAGLTWVDGPNVGTLAPGESTTGTATYVVTADDVTAGAVENSATATGKCDEGSGENCLPEKPPVEEIVPTCAEGECPEPDYEITKVADTEEPVGVGETITYTFTVENTGNVPLYNFTIEDQLAGLTWVTGPNVGTIEPGATATGTATYVVTAADVTAGEVTNAATGTAECEEGSGEPCTPEKPPAEEIVPTCEEGECPAPDYEIGKEADTEGPVGVGETITYTFTVENTGDVPLANVTIADQLAGLTWVTGPNVGTIEPGDSARGTATYTITEDDVEAGSVYNVATVTGTTPDGGTVGDDDDDEVVACLVLDETDDGTQVLLNQLANAPIPAYARVNAAVLAAIQAEAEPTEEATEEPTEVVDEPTEVVVEEPTDVPADEPTDVPAEEPTEEPTEVPSDDPVETQAPVAIEDVVATQANTPVQGDARANDSDADTALDALTYWLGDPSDDLDGDPSTVDADELPQAGYVELHPTGTFVYTPNAAFAGDDRFVYTVVDPEGNRASSMVWITVTAVEEPTEKPTEEPVADPAGTPAAEPTADPVDEAPTDEAPAATPEAEFEAAVGLPDGCPDPDPDPDPDPKPTKPSGGGGGGGGGGGTKPPVTDLPNTGQGIRTDDARPTELLLLAAVVGLFGAAYVARTWWRRPSA